ncbi:hypothetical protein [Rhizobium oryziradicis]|uniref:hypothetical protein n=1 Tax=Rhizobium oryziradicis TaxID=1867956 RepID=UPI0011151BFD|nr:hypothetical protein [Rhizobium oryziradicis]
MTYRVFLKTTKNALRNFSRKPLCTFAEIALFIPHSHTENRLALFLRLLFVSQSPTENRHTLFPRLLYEVILNSRLTTAATAKCDMITQIGNEARQTQIQRNLRHLLSSRGDSHNLAPRQAL